MCRFQLAFSCSKRPLMDAHDQQMRIHMLYTLVCIKEIRGFQMFACSASAACLHHRSAAPSPLSSITSIWRTFVSSPRDDLTCAELRRSCSPFRLLYVINEYLTARSKTRRCKLLEPVSRVPHGRMYGMWRFSRHSCDEAFCCTRRHNTQVT
jgi:hypothetical protein